MPFYIYGLIDPRKPAEVRYVGCSINMPARMAKHKNRKDHGNLRAWCNRLKADGLAPSYVLLEQQQERDAAWRAEASWIDRLRSTGLLLNVQVGRCVPPRPCQRQLKLPVTASGFRLADIWAAKPAHITRLSDLELWTAQHVLLLCGGNKLETARVLGIGRQTLYNKLAAMAG